jgi:hypothetical protein
MTPLVRGVDGAKTHTERECNEGRSVIFFPGCAVEKFRGP